MCYLVEMPSPFNTMRNLYIEIGNFDISSKDWYNNAIMIMILVEMSNFPIYLYISFRNFKSSWWTNPFLRAWFLLDLTCLPVILEYDVSTVFSLSSVSTWNIMNHNTIVFLLLWAMRDEWNTSIYCIFSFFNEILLNISVCTLYRAAIIVLKVCTYCYYIRHLEFSSWTFICSFLILNWLKNDFGLCYASFIVLSRINLVSWPFALAGIINHSPRSVFLHQKVSVGSYSKLDEGKYPFLFRY